MTDLATPLRGVVGGRTATALSTAFGMTVVEDLLRHYPRRYAEKGELTDLSDLEVSDHVTVMARIATARVIPFKDRPGKRLLVEITDGTGRLQLTFFGPKDPKKRVPQEFLLQPGKVGLFSGEVGSFNGALQLVHPQYELVPEGAEVDGSWARPIIAVYPATRAVPSWQIARAVDVALSGLTAVTDAVPEEVRRDHGLPDLATALRLVHQPQTEADWQTARDRLRWDEAFALQVALARRRHIARSLPAVSRVAGDAGLLAAFDRSLPFSLTAGQRDVGAQVAADLAQAHPMHRLLQGEVGSGKTVVALRAMLAVVDAGGQAALLAPTEVLAQQHHRSLQAMLGPLAQSGRLDSALLAEGQRTTRVALLTGSANSRERREALLDAASGEAGIVVGTHALLAERVQFADLALVVVDEQHRFGVEQRAALAEKARDGSRPHVLVMTATPIPRTVAITVFGDLDVSTLTELPPGRRGLTSHVVPARDKPAFLARAWQRVREEVAAGHKAYVVCPRIGVAADAEDTTEPPPADGAADGERTAGAAVLEVATLLTDGPLAGLRVGVLHGRLRPEEKDTVMSRFAAPAEQSDAIDVLVSTTVIEVGVDVPAATVMVVMDADRFGVSALHQLRGRVGRGSAPGLALLVTSAPAGSPARSRLDQVAATTDGFALARLDLASRREGDVLGGAQSGRRSSLRLLSVLADEDVIVAARDAATAVVEADPDLLDHPDLRRAVDALVDDRQADFLAKG